MIFIIILLCISDIYSSVIDDINLPKEHLTYFMNSNGNVGKKPKILDKDGVIAKCWGHEDNCKNDNSFTKMICDADSLGWASSKSKQKEMFFEQADFGYVRKYSSNLQAICERKQKEDSYLACTKNLEFCKGNNIAIDFGGLVNRTQPVRYHMDVLKDGEISGKCRLKKKLLNESLEFMSPLQSWAPEMRFFNEKEMACDVWIEKPSIIIKIDAPVSMYHHFCDFFNLFASLHVNSSNPFDFNTDTQILIWETYVYRSNFGVSWQAFTKHPVWNLNDVKGKRVCFRNVMFPLLARGIFGLFYNTPIVPGCHGSGLFRAFSEYFLHRLNVPLAARSDKIHISFLSRGTKYRKIINENALLKALKKDHNFIVRQVEFTHYYPFIKQLEQDRWTDILIGIHGSGLTHMLFLPDWAVVLEIYNCEDPNCYHDLARERGLKYLTWEKKDKLYMHDDVIHPEHSDHEKYRNFSFDRKEFLRLVKKAEKYIRNNAEWKKAQQSHVKEEL